MKDDGLLHATLVDDGTMDTVLHFDCCDTEERYSEADRDESGSVTEEWIQECEDNHECPEEEDDESDED